MTITGSSIIPSLRYRDARAAIEWLTRVFGFTAQAVYDGPNNSVAHAQLTCGAGMLMLGSETDMGVYARQSITLRETGGRETIGLCLIAEDAEEIYKRVKAAGVEILEEISSPPYGGRAFACRDIEGHIWWVGSYNPWAGPQV
jgi:uncharacterized glyoxalase superfamily protein PhnB